MNDEITRLRAAISTIHDHLHAGRINEAHQACECAMDGVAVKQQHLSVPDSAKAAIFAHKFNELTQELGLHAAFFAILPSATKPGYVSVQIGGEVTATRMLENQLGRSSTYMGEHIQ